MSVRLSHARFVAKPCKQCTADILIRTKGNHCSFELFSLSVMVETLWAEICRSRAFFEGGGSLWAQISDGRKRHPPTTVGVKKLEWLTFRVVSNYLQCIIWLCHKARV